jgi:hypothetical protein
MPMINPLARQSKNHCGKHEPCLKDWFFELLRLAVQAYGIDAIHDLGHPKA